MLPANLLEQGEGKMLLKRLTAAAFAGALTLGPVAAQDAAENTGHPNVLTFEQLADMFQMDPAGTEITVQTVAEGLHVFFGAGGNIAVSAGADGALIVDDQFPEMIPKVKASLKDLGVEAIDFVVNTHWHFDHADGNLVLGQEGTWIVSHAKARERMTADHLINFGPLAYEQKAYPPHAQSDITFDGTMQFHYNSELVELVHHGAAHTDGDTAVIFRGKNAVHMGDVYNNTGFPFIDADNGGSIEGIINFCQKVHDDIDDNTIVIPGHGPVVGRAELARYIEVLTIVRDRVQALIDEGKDLDAIIAANPTADLNEEMNANDTTLPAFLNRVYVSLTRS